jgi:hypothetical protein
MVRVVCEGKSDIKQIKSILKFLNIEFKEEHFIFTNGKSFLLNKSTPKYKTLPEKPYAFEHQNFNELKQKLKNLFKEEN